MTSYHAISQSDSNIIRIGNQVTDPFMDTVRQWIYFNPQNTWICFNLFPMDLFQSDKDKIYMDLFQSTSNGSVSIQQRQNISYPWVSFKPNKKKFKFICNLWVSFNPNKAIQILIQHKNK